LDGLAILILFDDKDGNGSWSVCSKLDIVPIGVALGCGGFCFDRNDLKVKHIFVTILVRRINDINIISINNKIIIERIITMM
jgi:hypothetical protein